MSAKRFLFYYKVVWARAQEKMENLGVHRPTFHPSHSIIFHTFHNKCKKDFYGVIFIKICIHCLLFSTAKYIFSKYTITKISYFFGDSLSLKHFLI